MTQSDKSTTACECCRGLTALTPAKLTNPPGLPTLTYRVGTHFSFKATMLARLSNIPGLARLLTTRLDDDPTIALLDAWALVADVLTFYQERIANEGYLRTAAERRSLLELARTIGYELGPGVAANTHLAFTLDDSPKSPQKVIVPAGTRARSLPDKEELPQTFETDEEIVARPEWNALKPRMTRPQYFNKDTRTFYFKGTETNLKAGDWVLLKAREKTDPDDTTGTIDNIPLQVVRIKPDDINQRTRVDLEGSQSPPLQYEADYAPAQFKLVRKELTGANVHDMIAKSVWHAQDLSACTHIQRWPKDKLRIHIQKARKTYQTLPSENVGVFAFRVKTAPFGHNAPKWETTPKEWREPLNTAPYSSSWENSAITRYANGDPYQEDHRLIYLENTFPTIQANSWVMIKSAEDKPEVYWVDKTSERSLADFGLSAKATGLTLNKSAEEHKVRETTIYAQSERLELADLPIESNVEEDRLELDSWQPDLTVGQTLILTGERGDLDGVIESEVRILHDIVHIGGYTHLIFTEPLEHSYKPSTVTINANVAHATHGETKQQALGSGDAAEPMQRFVLSQKPLTYVSAPVASGALSTLEVRVNEVLWHEKPDLYRLGPNDRAYIVRHDNEGRAIVQFGDGVHGTRIPTGIENIRAKFRVGTGFAGLVDADRISLLQTRPLGVKEVANPLPTTDAEEPETLEKARQNAPLTVLTLDRIVSLKDFEDFARAFSGIGKAAATWLWDGESDIVHLTIAAANGDTVATDSRLYKNLLKAMNRLRDPFQRLRIDSFQPVPFNLDAKLRVHPDYRAEKVLKEVEARLRSAFSFNARAFAHGVTLSQVMAVIQQVPGVEAVTVNHFHYSHETPSRQPRLLAAPARLLPDGTLQLAQLLTITPDPISLSVVD